MKSTIICLIAIIFSSSLYAQPEKAKLKTHMNTADVQMTRPVESSSDSQYKDIGKAHALPGMNGKYTHSWTLKDGTKVTNTFDYGTGMVMTPLNPKANKPNINQRNFQETTDEKGGSCTTVETRISLNNDAFLTVDNLDQASHLYPGAIYKFENYVDGSWREENGNRNPITISTSSLGVKGNVYVTVNQPNSDSIRNAINKLTSRFTSTANGAFKTKVEEVTSQADANLKIGASGSGFGFSASYLFNFNESRYKKYLLVDCTQEIFLVDTKFPTNGFFQNPDQATRDMMYISSVTYGVRVLASIETTKINKEMSNKLDASYSAIVADGEFNFDAYMKDFKEETVIKMYVIGGPKPGIYPAFNKAELINIIQGIFRDGTNAQVQPIKYTFRNMEGGVIMSQSATDYFTNQSCTPPGPLTYTTKLNSVARGDDSDWELYGQIWVQVFGPDKKEIYSVNGGDRLMALDEANHLNSSEAGYRPKGEVTFRLNEDQQHGAVMLIWYWLNDYDSGSGNDFLSMREGQKMRYNKNGDNYFCRIIPLGDMKPGSGANKIDFTDEFTDDESDSKTMVSGIVTCAAINMNK